jgi:tryptophanyl-tRNA synthetase
MEVVLTGIKPTGQPGMLHIGNYVGAMKPAVAASKNPHVQSYYFLADYHAIGGNAEAMARSTLEIAASWLAVGLDAEQVVLYRQSDVPEILELAWILHCMTAKGLMNRAHAYKAVVAENEAVPGRDPDQGIMMHLYSYPVLMAADILMFKAAKVPVGRDQKQHVEMARDIAQRFNHHFGETFVLPDAVIGDNVATQARHEDQDELARARPAEGSERQRALRRLSRVRDRRRDRSRARALRRGHRLG